MANPELRARRKKVQKESNLKWIENNRDTIRKWRREYESQKYRTDLQYKIAHNHRARVYSALRAQQATKDSTSLELMGCTLEIVIQHIENQFQEGMSWENWAHDTWHIDHIRPCASFDLTNESELRECFHYTNLQPLWANENMSKGDKWDQEVI